MPVETSKYEIFNPAEFSVVSPVIEVSKPARVIDWQHAAPGLDQGVDFPKYQILSPEEFSVITPTIGLEVSLPAREGRMKHLAKDLGAVVLGPAILFGSIFGAASIMKNHDQPSFAAAQLDAMPATSASTTSTEAPTTTEVTTTTTTAAPTTTTEAPRPPIEFKAKPGDVIATISIPALCENISVYEVSEQEKISGQIGTGSATIDKLTLDPAGPEMCNDIEQRMAPGAWKRSTRYRDNLKSAQNPRGNVNYYLPVAGHEQRVDGIPTSSYPTDAGGNFVVYGHGSTESAPLANAVALRPGDTASVLRSDGRTYHYVMIESKVVPGNNDTEIRQYKNPFYDSTMSIYMCSDAEGHTGSDANRYVTRWGLVSVASTRAK